MKAVYHICDLATHRCLMMTSRTKKQARCPPSMQPYVSAKPIPLDLCRKIYIQEGTRHEHCLFAEAENRKPHDDRADRRSKRRSGLPVARIIAGATYNPCLNNVADVVRALHGSIDEMEELRPEEGDASPECVGECVC